MGLSTATSVAPTGTVSRRTLSLRFGAFLELTLDWLAEGALRPGVENLDALPSLLLF
jgi:hypothetical protein